MIMFIYWWAIICYNIFTVVFLLSATKVIKVKFGFFDWLLCPVIAPFVLVVLAVVAVTAIGTQFIRFIKYAYGIFNKRWENHVGWAITGHIAAGWDDDWLRLDNLNPENTLQGIAHKKRLAKSGNSLKEK
jgi:hypothetical protein